VIVLDASALVELVLSTATGLIVADRIVDPALGLHIPRLADIEVAQALRRYAQKGEVDTAEALEVLADLRDLALQRHTHEPLLDRVWELRENLSAYDAVYIALAEALDAIVVTLYRLACEVTYFSILLNSRCNESIGC
jgi:predicted nucleic acid-binding protein